MKKIRFNKAGIDNSCMVKICRCRQGRPIPTDKGMCVCTHSHFHHRLIFKNPIVSYPKPQEEIKTMALTNVIDQLKIELKTKQKEVAQITKALRFFKSDLKIASKGTRRKLSPEAIEKIRKGALKRWANKRKALKK